MPRAMFEDVITYLRHAAALGADCDLTDAQLLDRFLTQREETAFTFLVQRHGPMILGVGRRVLGDAHEAEDVLQATFLILARRTRALGGKRSIGGWLHGVAHHVALKAKATLAARRKREREIRTMPSARPVDDLTCQELRNALDEAIASLPEKYNAPVVLCDLEGKSYDQAARELGCPKTTLARRLTQARELLRKKLVRRGIGLTSAALATALAEVATASPMPAMLTIKTVKAAGLVVEGKAVAGCLSAGAIALAEEAMIVAKGKLVLMVMVVGLAVGGVGWAGYKTLAETSRLHPPPVSRDVQRSADSVPRRAIAVDQYGDPLPAGALARFGTVRFRDLAQPTPQLTYAAGGKILISSGAQFFGICAWDADSGRPLYRLTAPTGAMSLAVSPDGKSLFSQGDLGIFWGIDVATGKKLRQFLPGAWGQAAFSPDGHTVAVAKQDGWELIRWDFNTGKVLRRLGKENEMGSAVAFAPDGKSLATASRDNSIRLWNGATGKEIRRFIGHEKLVYSVAFAPDGKVVASAGDGDVIRLWDVDNDKPVRLLTGSDGYNSKVLFSPDGKFLATTGSSGELHRNMINSESLRLWDLSTGKEIHRWDLITAMAFSPDGNVLATARRDGVIRRWNTATGKEIDPPTGHAGRLMSLRFTGDGKTLFSRAWNGSVMEWDMRKVRARRSLFDVPSAASGAAPWRVADVSPDGKRVALINWQNAQPDAIRLWDTHAAKEIRTLGIDKGSALWVRECVFSPDGKILAGPGKSGLRLWDVASGNVVRDLPAAPGYFAFSPDGTRLATSARSDKIIRLWDLATGKETHHWPSGQRPYGTLAFLMGGKWLASSDPKSLHIWDVESGKQLLKLAEDEGRGFREPLAFSPSGRIVAVGGRRQWQTDDEFFESGTIRLLDLYSGEKIHQFDVPQGEVSSLAFTPDGRTLASGGWDSTILLWDMTNQPPRDKRTPGVLAAVELNELWSDLAGEAPKAERALWRLAWAPKQSLPLFKDRLRSVRLQPELVAKLLTDLDSERFALRQNATKTLDELGEVAEGAVHKTLEGNPSLETRKRLEQFLGKRKKEMIRKLRAIEVLEQIGTPDARRLLQKLSHEAPNPRVVQAASGALDRLAKAP